MRLSKAMASFNVIIIIMFIIIVMFITLLLLCYYYFLSSLISAGLFNYFSFARNFHQPCSFANYL